MNRRIRIYDLIKTRKVYENRGIASKPRVTRLTALVHKIASLWICNRKDGKCVLETYLVRWEGSRAVTPTAVTCDSAHKDHITDSEARLINNTNIKQGDVTPL